MDPLSPSERPSFGHPPSTYSHAHFTEARAAYLEAIPDPFEHHAEVGILSPSGEVSFARFGKPEAYGAHRIGSVTKTFTTFLALKLNHDGLLPSGLTTKCGEILDHEMLAAVFEDVEAAKNMTLEQLLSHTSGLDFDDHCRQQHPPQKCTLQERFLQESTSPQGGQYKHVCQPGDRVGFYSNAGVAVAGWMLESAYNRRHGTQLSFAQIMQQELFEKVFHLSESFIAAGPSGDVIQSAAGDMTSSVTDLMKVAKCLQEGEHALAGHFGEGWQSLMLKPRDLLQEHGLGCTANIPVIQYMGLNRELFGARVGDVSAVVEFPLRPGEPGLVAMCDSRALGPSPNAQRFIGSLETLAGLQPQVVEGGEPPPALLEYFCPPHPHLFHGNAYLAIDQDPFTAKPPDNLICSRNGIRHDLVLDTRSSERAYRDEAGRPWFFITTSDGRHIIYSSLCLLTEKVSKPHLDKQQPSASLVRTLQGTYTNIENPKDHPIFVFTEKDGQLYMREEPDMRDFPCLYIPDDEGGAWVHSNPEGGKIKIRFPTNPDEEFLTIMDVSTGLRLPPFHSRRIPT